jgi:hypothetical protein
MTKFYATCAVTLGSRLVYHDAYVKAQLAAPLVIWLRGIKERHRFFQGTAETVSLQVSRHQLLQ